MVCKLESKSDAELEREILKIRDRLRADPVAYEKQMSMLNSLIPMMSGSRKARLRRVIELLK